MHEVGAVLLAKLLNSDPGGSGAGVKCAAGHAATFVDYRSKEITTVVGAVEFRRAYYHCEECGEGVLPQDAALEAGCKTIVGYRLKQSGMRWSLGGANAIIALRCAQLSGRWEEFWEMRAAG